MQGIIKKKDDKGYGFIAVEGEPKDVFFHQKALVGVSFSELQEGETVTFDMTPAEDSPKGPSAANVKRA